MERKNHFQFFKDPHLNGITLLDASVSDFKYKRHSHDDYSIGVTMHGFQNFFCDGEYYRVPRGGVIQINPDETHDGYAEDVNGYSYFMIYIPRSLLHHAIQPYTDKKVFDFQFGQTAVANPKLRNILLAFIQSIKLQGQDRLHVDDLFLNVVESLVQANTPFNHAPVRPSKPDEIIIQAKTYIHAHLNQTISLDDLSRALHVSKFYFARLFKEQVGLSPYQYMLNSKVNAAKRELELGRDLFSIIEQYGFYDLSHFTRRFKEMYGTTPYEFQQHIVNSRGF